MSSCASAHPRRAPPCTPAKTWEQLRPKGCVELHKEVDTQWGTTQRRRMRGHAVAWMSPEDTVPRETGRSHVTAQEVLRVAGQSKEGHANVRPAAESVGPWTTGVRGPQAEVNEAPCTSKGSICFQPCTWTCGPQAPRATGQ